MPLRAHSPCEGKAPRAVESDRIGGLDALPGVRQTSSLPGTIGCCVPGGDPGHLAGGWEVHCTMRTLYSILSSRPNKMGHDITLPYCDIIQHIFIPTRSVARKTLL